VKKIKQNPDKVEGIIQSLSGPIPSVVLKNCPGCLTEKDLGVIVNYSAEDPVEYFAFVICGKCDIESDGGGIFYDYYNAVLSAQETWNTEELEKPDGQKNPNKSE